MSCFFLDGLLIEKKIIFTVLKSVKFKVCLEPRELTRCYI